jgi:hypothetical protein
LLALRLDQPLRGWRGLCGDLDDRRAALATDGR